MSMLQRCCCDAGEDSEMKGASAEAAEEDQEQDANAATILGRGSSLAGHQEQQERLIGGKSQPFGSGTESDCDAVRGGSAVAPLSWDKQLIREDTEEDKLCDTETRCKETRPSPQQIWCSPGTQEARVGCEPDAEKAGINESEMRPHFPWVSDGNPLVGATITSFNCETAGFRGARTRLLPCIVRQNSF